MHSSQDDPIKDRPRPLSSISRQHKSKSLIARTASGKPRATRGPPVSDRCAAVSSCGSMSVFTGSDFGGGASIRRDDLDHDLDREVTLRILYKPASLISSDSTDSLALALSLSPCSVGVSRPAGLRLHQALNPLQ